MVTAGRPRKYEDGGEMKRVPVAIDKNVSEELSKYCRENGLIKRHIVTEAIKQYLKEKNL